MVVTHPFHPLRGQRLEVLYSKRRGADTVFVCSGGFSGQITLPLAWTDRGELPAVTVPAVLDRMAQAALKLVLEPVFEADFLPCSYGFRPNRYTHDAVAEVRFLSFRPREYEWIVEGDIRACFDEISHRPSWSGCGRASGTSACWRW